ncbi:hypothetical protein CLV30_1327 [Haloactinopolyspora alba]|uniref:Uncharacterized protein n=2 Tax=Haloactinopolyspora alba TaxID=648780 RepID=A0A2P8D5C0_9ACTN|nr:hypothetical protein CLV30_1327 [Haloactinopolyspora alba]
MWLGGGYQLAIEVGERDDDRLQATLVALWRAAGVDGCRARGDGGGFSAVPCTRTQLEATGLLAGVAALPRGTRVVCAARAVRHDSGTDWLVFFVPTGALERAEPRSAAFGFRGGDSLLWRRPLDRWLAEIGRQLYAAVPFRLGLIGPDVVGMTAAWKLAGTVPPERWAGYLVPTGADLAYYCADR